MLFNVLYPLYKHIENKIWATVMPPLLSSIFQSNECRNMSQQDLSDQAAY